MQALSQQVQQQIIQSSFESCIQKSKSNSKSFQQPTPRIFHSSVCHRAYIFVYGGLSLNPQQQFQNEHLFIYRYEIHRFQWKKIQINFPSNLGKKLRQLTIGGLNPLQNIYSHSCAVHGNVMYLFGGKNGKNGQCINQLWAMNLQSFNWRKQDQKGIVPARRQSASFVLCNKSYLFLYGGKNQDYIFNDIHIYKIDSKQWHSIQTSTSQFLMCKRLRPGIAVVNDVIYIFGGERQSSIDPDKMQQLDDFYQIKIIQKSTSVKPDIWLKKVSTLLNPGKLIEGKLFAVNDRYIFVFIVLLRYVGLLGSLNQIVNIDDIEKNKLGSDSQNKIKPKLWLYDPLKIKWIFSRLDDPSKCGIGLGFSVLFQYDRVYISCGIRTSNYNPAPNLCSIYIDVNELPTTIPPVSVQDLPNGGRLCLLCQQQKHSLCRKKLRDFTLFQNCIKQMKYPFNAFGLLVDNSNLLKCSQINIQCAYLVGGKQKYILIEDDGSLQNVWSNQEEFLQDMIKFRTISEQEMEVQGDAILPQGNQNNAQANMNMDIQQSQGEKIKPQHNQLAGLQGPIATNKEDQIFGSSAKKQEDKQQQRKLKKKKQLAKRTKAKQLRKRKQFSLNLKIGGMRLGKKMIYITRTSDGTKRVFFIQQIKIHSLDQQQLGVNQGQVRYQCHYYSVPSQNSTHNSSSANSSSSQLSRLLVQSQYKTYLKLIHDANPLVKNHLIIICLRDMVTQYNVRQPELKINTKLNDIYYGSNKLLVKAESISVSLPDCIDVSLKCYLSMIYLGSSSSKIAISTHQQKVQEISNSAYFEKLDSLVKSNTIMDLQKAFDLEQCKIVELYYCQNLVENNSKKLSTRNEKKQKASSNKQIQSSPLQNTFFNGILIYHKNRLIKRYQYPFGTLLKYNNLEKQHKNYNPLKIFGFIELDEVFYSNILKTDLVNEENLNNMYARIKFVENLLEQKCELRSLENFNQTGKRSQKNLQDEEDKHFESKKKIKGD